MCVCVCEREREREKGREREGERERDRTFFAYQARPSKKEQERVFSLNEGGSIPGNGASLDQLRPTCVFLSDRTRTGAVQQHKQQHRRQQRQRVTRKSLCDAKSVNLVNFQGLFFKRP